MVYSSTKGVASSAQVTFSNRIRIRNDNKETATERERGKSLGWFCFGEKWRQKTKYSESGKGEQLTVAEAPAAKKRAAKRYFIATRLTDDGQSATEFGALEGF